MGSPGLVEAGVEDERAVAAELDAIADVRDGVIEDLTRGQVLDDEVETLVPGAIRGEREPIVVVTDRQGADGEELAVARLDVAVDEDLLARDGLAVQHRSSRTIGQRGTGLHGILLALDGAAVIPPRPAGHRHREIGLEDP